MKIPCQKCGGNGRVELPKRLGEGYAALKELGASTVATFSAKMGLELTASHHLMRRLVGSGLVKQVEGVSPAMYRVAKRGE